MSILGGCSRLFPKPRTPRTIGAKCQADERHSCSTFHSRRNASFRSDVVLRHALPSAARVTMHEGNPHVFLECDSESTFEIEGQKGYIAVYDALTIFWQDKFCKESSFAMGSGTLVPQPKT